MSGHIAWLGFSFAALFLASCAFALLVSRAFGIALDALNRFVNSPALIPPQKATRQAALFSAFVGLCWVVVWLAAFPGYSCYDTVHFVDFASDGSLSNQQPILHTIIVGLLCRIGLRLFGSWNAAVALYMVFQLMALLLLLACLFRWFLLRGVGKVVVAAIAVYYALNPLMCLFAVCTVKDSIFSAVATCLIVLLYSAFKDASRRRRACFYVAMGVIAFLFLCYRNTSIYVVAVFLLLLSGLWVHRSRTKQESMEIRVVVLTLSCSLVLFAVSSAALQPFLQVQQANSQRETISHPVAWLGRMAAYGMLEDDALASFGVDVGQLARAYENKPDNSDNWRTLFWGTVDASGSGELVTVAAGYALRHPFVALEASMILTQSAWDATSTVDAYQGAAVYDYDSTKTSVFACWVEVPAWQESKLSGLADLFWQISRNVAFRDNPLLAMVMSPALYCWLLVLVLLRCMERHNIAGLLICLFLLCITATALLGPTVLIRYYLFLVAAAPVLVFVAADDCDGSLLSKRIVPLIEQKRLSSACVSNSEKPRL